MQGCPYLGYAEDPKLDTEYKAALAAEAQFNASKIRGDRATLDRIGMRCEDIATRASRDAIEAGREKSAEQGFKA